MEVSSFDRVFPTFECWSDPEYSGRSTSGKSIPLPIRKPHAVSFIGSPGTLSSLVFKFPPNFVRQLSTKSRRNCSNIGVAQVVAASYVILEAESS